MKRFVVETKPSKAAPLPQRLRQTKAPRPADTTADSPDLPWKQPPPPITLKPRRSLLLRFRLFILAASILTIFQATRTFWRGAQQTTHDGLRHMSRGMIISTKKRNPDTLLPLETVPRLRVSELGVTRSTAKHLPTTRIIPNKDYAFLTFENVCYVSSKRLLILLGNTTKIEEAVEESRNTSLYPSAIVWDLLHHPMEPLINIFDIRYTVSSQAPDTFKWIPGNTTLITFARNTYHMLMDRLWPIVFSKVPSLSSGTPNSRWLQQQQQQQQQQHYLFSNLPEDILGSTILWQAAASIAMDPRADFVDFTPRRRNRWLHRSSKSLEQEEGTPVCLERLKITCRNCYRLHWEGTTTTGTALRAYRAALSEITGQVISERHSPPEKLRVALYTRMGDTIRRRIVNGQHILEMLRLHPCKCMDVVSVDRLMQDQSPPGSLSAVRHVKLLGETDLLIASHSSFLALVMMMPMHAGVIEIGGPCRWKSWSQRSLFAINATHDTSNPVGLSLPSPVAGNTTDCKSYDETPDFTVDLQKLRTIVDNFLRSWGYLPLPSEQ